MDLSEKKLHVHTIIVLAGLFLYHWIIYSWVKTSIFRGTTFLYNPLCHTVKVLDYIAGFYLLSKIRQSGRNIQLFKKINPVYIFVAFLFSMIISTLILYYESNMHTHIKAIFFYSPEAFLLTLFFAGIPEEFLFRVGVQEALGKGKWQPIIIQSIICMIFHIPLRFFFEPEALTQTLITSFCLGIIHGYLWKKYQNFGLNVALHTGWDTPFIADRILHSLI